MVKHLHTSSNNNFWKSMGINPLYVWYTQKAKKYFVYFQRKEVAITLLIILITYAIIMWVWSFAVAIKFGPPTGVN
jgi:uncharacterized Tic20 family protein